MLKSIIIKGKEMYKYTFKAYIVKFIKKKERNNTYYCSYDIFKDYFKLKNSPMFWAVYREFNSNLDYTFFSKNKLKEVPVAGYLLPACKFEEINIL